VTPPIADEEPTQERVGLGSFDGLASRPLDLAVPSSFRRTRSTSLRLRRSPSNWFVNNAATSRFLRIAGDRREVVVAAVRDRHAIEETPRSLSATFRLSPPCPARWTTLMPPRPISPSTLWPAISDPQVERLLDGRVR
jgi:hypothetical protein